MERRPLGRTGLEVSALGLGAGRIGAAAASEREAERLVLGALDLGVTLFDTAASYGASEERLGRILAARRGEVVLSSKGGYGVPGVPDWTGAAVAGGIEAALRRLRTDRLDLFHLHSCPLDVLRRDDVLGALAAAVRDGKVRLAAYSGEESALAWAVASGRFSVVQASVNPFDQRGLEAALAEASARGLGVLAKRALGNAVWRGEPPGDDAAALEYRRRFEAMALDPGGLDWDALALRFSAHTPGVSSALVGTSSLERLRRAAAVLAQGPLPPDLLAAVRARFASCDRGWTGQV